MRAVSGIAFQITAITGECLALSLFLCSAAFADTVFLKDGKELKGLVVERHEDRIILSTEKGEMPILLKGVKDISYDAPEQSLIQVASSYEKEGRLGEAIAYYEKALEINPNLPEAKKPLSGLRNRFRAVSTEGPRNEIERQQTIHDAWSEGRPVEDLIKKQKNEHTKYLRNGLGLSLEKKGDWVCVDMLDPKKDAFAAGLKKNDRLVAIDGKSLRYLSVEAVTNYLLSPHFSNFTLEYDRNCYLGKEEGENISLKDAGVKLKLEYEGVRIQSVDKNSSGARAGLRKGDFLTQVNGTSTRYMPLNNISSLVQETTEDRIVFTARRSVSLVRK